MARLNNGSSAVYDFGPGGYARIPLRNRFIKIFNNTGYDMFIPDNSTAEKLSVYNNFSVPGATKLFGQYAVGNNLFNNRSAIGTGPCWNGTPGGSYQTPAACPSGFTQTELVNNAMTNANLFRFWANNEHNTSNRNGWMAFQEWDYGCTVGPPTWYWHRVTNRVCVA